jgi:hypothetical protein
MKLVHRFILLVFLVVCLLPAAQAKKKPKPKPKTVIPPCSQGTPYRRCPACGTAKDAKHITLNVQKNRGTKATNPQTLTVAEIRDPANNNNGKFSPSKKVSVTGFVAGVEPGGMPETCNCTSKKPGGRTDLRDVHINIVADPSEAADQTKYVIVEFTPRWEKTFGFDDSNYEAMRQLIESQIKGKRVKFSGWMLYDFIHEDASQSIRPNQPVCANFGDKNCNWRATPWEVHPVTAYTVVTGP